MEKLEGFYPNDEKSDRQNDIGQMIEGGCLSGFGQERRE